MKQLQTTIGASILSLAWLSASGACAQETPILVAAFARQLAEQCGPLPRDAPAPLLVERVDLNGDKLDDWVVDASRYPCPSRPALSAAAGSQVTVFKGVDGGFAVPAFQKPAFGSSLVRKPNAPPALWIVLGGSDCGATDPSVRCERRVLWHGQRGAFEAASERQ